MSAELKNDLRQITVGADVEFKKEIVEWKGKEFEIREPSVSTRGKIIAKSGISTIRDNPEGASMDFSESQIYAVIYCTFVPGTDERVFDPKDAPMLRNQPAGSFVDKFSSVAMRMMNVDAEEEAKN